MNQILTILLYELRRNLFRRGFLISTFGLPLVAVAIFFGGQLIGGGDNPQEQINELVFDTEAIDQAGYVDYSGAFPQPGELAAPIMTRFDDEASAETALEAGEIDLYYIVPEDYLETGDVRLIAPSFSIAQLNQAPIAQLFYSQFANDIDQNTLLRLVNPPLVEAIDLSEGDAEATTVDQEAADNTLIQIFAIVFVLAIFGTNGYLMQSVIEEKETRLIEILIASVRPFQLLTGKILGLGALGLFQLVVYIGTLLIAITLSSGGASPLAGISIEFGQLLIALIYFILGYLLFAALFGAVGAVSTSISEGPALTTIFILPALAPWFFAPILAEAPNGALATGLSIFPLTAPLTMVIRPQLTDISVVQHLLSIAILVASIASMMWFAGRLFRVQTLLSGRMPRLNELPQILRG